VLHYTWFARYLHTLVFTSFIPEPPRRENSYVPYIFSQDELARLFAAVDGCMMTKNCKENSRLQIPLVFRLLYGCGLRLDEALTLRTGDVNVEAGTLLIGNAKDNKDRLVPMDASLAKILHQYMKVTGKTSSQELLFDNGHGERHPQDWARKWFRWILDEAGIAVEELPRYGRNICPHCLRHTFAVNSFRKQDIAGVDLYVAAPLLSAYMGHVKIYGTERYLHMTAENSKDILDKTRAYTAGLFPEVPQ
jgi:integrase